MLHFLLLHNAAHLDSKQVADCWGAPSLQAKKRSPFMPSPEASARLGNEAGMQMQQPAQRRTLTVGAEGSGMPDVPQEAPHVVGSMLRVQTFAGALCVSFSLFQQRIERTCL